MLATGYLTHRTELRMLINVVLGRKVHKKLRDLYFSPKNMMIT